LRIGGVEPVDLLPGDAPAGQVLAVDPMPIVATLPGSVRLTRVQAPGKKMMDADAWARGARLAVGERLG
jgi:methionyl-tRNA formyltransferase